MVLLLYIYKKNLFYRPRVLITCQRPPPEQDLSGSKVSLLGLKSKPKVKPQIQWTTSVFVIDDSLQAGATVNLIGTGVHYAGGHRRSLPDLPGLHGLCPSFSFFFFFWCFSVTVIVYQLLWLIFTWLFVVNLIVSTLTVILDLHDYRIILFLLIPLVYDL